MSAQQYSARAWADALKLAVKFHETYERLAPSFGYETRKETREFDPTTPNGRLMIAVCEELAPALRQWQPIETAPHMRQVLVFYRNSHEKGRTVKARFVPRLTEQSDSEDATEYSDEKDEYFFLEGWYEQIDNWDDFSEVFIHEKLTHWMPLPEPPVT